MRLPSRAAARESRFAVTNPATDWVSRAVLPACTHSICPARSVLPPTSGIFAIVYRAGRAHETLQRQSAHCSSEEGILRIDAGLWAVLGLGLGLVGMSHPIFFQNHIPLVPAPRKSIIKSEVVRVVLEIRPLKVHCISLIKTTFSLITFARVYQHMILTTWKCAYSCYATFEYSLRFWGGAHV